MACDNLCLHDMRTDERIYWNLSVEKLAQGPLALPPELQDHHSSSGADAPKIAHAANGQTPNVPASGRAQNTHDDKNRNNNNSITSTGSNASASNKQAAEENVHQDSACASQHSSQHSMSQESSSSTDGSMSAEHSQASTDTAAEDHGHKSDGQTALGKPPLPCVAAVKKEPVSQGLNKASGQTKVCAFFFVCVVVAVYHCVYMYLCADCRIRAGPYSMFVSDPLPHMPVRAPWASPCTQRHTYAHVIQTLTHNPYDHCSTTLSNSTITFSSLCARRH